MAGPPRYIGKTAILHDTIVIIKKVQFQWNTTMFPVRPFEKRAAACRRKSVLKYQTAFDSLPSPPWSRLDKWNHLAQ